MDPKALSKIQTICIAAIIVIATVSSGLAFFLFDRGGQSNETIKIGVCADLDNSFGKSIWQEVVLAVEQVNAEGGVLDRRFEVVAEDDDSESGTMDVAVATNAITRLVTVDEAYLVITSGVAFSSIYQELASQHKKIIFDAFATEDALTQKVLDDYERYKYYFRVGIPNATSAYEGTVDAIATFREYTGFNKVALVASDLGVGAAMFSGTVEGLETAGFDVVYTVNIPIGTVDFSSYFAQAEAAGAEIVYSMVILGQAGIPFVREYYDRQSPMILCGVIGGSVIDFWELTQGKCEFVSCNSYPTGVGYPLTSKTLAFRDASIARWGEASGGALYDAVRYILPDAIKRAGMFDTDAVIAALESVDVETSLARHFVFTSSHDIMIGEAGPNKPSEDYFLVCIFQWQNGKLVPVYPKELMEEAGATYKYPPWTGPWD